MIASAAAGENMRRIAVSGAWCTVVVAMAATGCRTGVSWQTFDSFRAYGESSMARMARADSQELRIAGLRHGRDYVSLNVDAISFRDLPRSLGSHVVVGLEVRGTGAKAIRVPFAVAATGARDGFRLEDVTGVGAFPFRG